MAPRFLAFFEVVKNFDAMDLLPYLRMTRVLPYSPTRAARKRAGRHFPKNMSQMIYHFNNKIQKYGRAAGLKVDGLNGLSV